MTNSWQARTLGESVKITKGVTYASSDYASEDEGHVFLTIKCFSKGGGFNSEGVKYYRGVHFPEQKIKPGDLLIAKTDLTRDGDIVGSPMIAPDFGDGRTVLPSMDLSVLRQQTEDVDLRFLFYRLMLGDARRFMWAHSAGSTVLHLESKALPKFTFSAPKHNEQHRIAEILSTLDETIEQTEALITKYHQIKAGLMHDLFTRGVTPDGRLRPSRAEAPHLYKESTIGWIPKEWEVVELKNEIGITHGFAFSGEYFSDTPPGDVLLTPGNFHRDGGLYFTSENTKYFQGPISPFSVLRNGEMVTVMTDLSPQTLILGRFAIIETPFPLLHNQRIGHVVLKRKERWDWNYLCYALNNERVRRKIIVEATGTTVRHTSPRRILNNAIARPSLEEQQRSTEVLQSIERRLIDEQENRNKLTYQKHGLMHDLLTGRVRVRLPEPPPHNPPVPYHAPKK